MSSLELSLLSAGRFYHEFMGAVEWWHYFALVGLLLVASFVISIFTTLFMKINSKRISNILGMTFAFILTALLVEFFARNSFKIIDFLSDIGSLGSTLVIATSIISLYAVFPRKNQKNKRLSKLLNSISGVLLIIYFVIFVSLFVFYGHHTVNSILDNDILYINTLNTISIEILGPHAQYLLLFFPFYALVIKSAVSRDFPKLANAILGLWTVSALIVMLIYIINSIIRNPIVLLFFIAVFGLFQLIQAKSWSKSDILGDLFSGMTFRARQARLKDQSVVIRQVTMIAIMSAFYLQMTISTSIQISYYSALLTGLLGIIGFLALIFTFSFEMIGSARWRRATANETKNAQGAIAILIGITIIGLFTSNSDITFSLETISINNFVAITVFTLSIIGGGAAIQFTIAYFHRIVDFVTETNFSLDGGVYAFAEMNTPADFSSVSSTETGLSEMRSHIEESGCQVLTIERANSVGIRRLRNTVIVIPRVIVPIGRSDAEFYRDFVARGNGLLLMIDQTDVKFKKEFLAILGFEALEPPQEWRKGQPVMCDIQNELEIQEIGRIRAALEKAVPLKFTEGVIQEMKNAGIPMVLQGESVVFALRELGSGFVIVVGSIDHWSNRAIAKADNILFLDYVQTTFRNALISPQRQ